MLMDFDCIFFIDGIRLNTILWYGIDYVILSDSCYANPIYQQDMGETTGKVGSKTDHNFDCFFMCNHVV